MSVYVSHFSIASGVFLSFFLSTSRITSCMYNSMSTVMRHYIDYIYLKYSIFITYIHDDVRVTNNIIMWRMILFTDSQNNK